MVYTALAPIYDRVMSHVQYDQWAALIRRVVARFLPIDRPRTLEIGGGTGVLAARLRSAGFPYTGSDRSFAMCRQARARAIAAVCADGCHLPFKARFDLALFLYDGINYLQTPQDYRRLFTEVHRCLDPGGLFLFDITTRTNSLRYFADHLDFEDFGDSAYVRHSYFEPRTDTQHNHFTIFTALPGGEGHFARSIEHHSQKLFTVSAIRTMVPRDLFAVVGTWDGYSFDPATAESERVHFLLRRGPAA